MYFHDGEAIPGQIGFHIAPYLIRSLVTLSYYDMETTIQWEVGPIFRYFDPMLIYNAETNVNGNGDINVECSPM